MFTGASSCICVWARLHSTSEDSDSLRWGQLSGIQQGGMVTAYQLDILLPGNPVTPGRLAKE